MLRSLTLPVPYRLPLIPITLSTRLEARHVLQSHLSDQLLAQLELLHLSAGRERERLDEADELRDFVAADSGLAIFADFVWSDLFALFRPNHRADLFPHKFIGEAYDLRLGYLRVAHQEVFDLRRVNVLAAANDHILHAPDDVDVTVGAHHRQIARMQPSLFVNRLGGLFGHVVIAPHIRERLRA